MLIQEPVQAAIWHCLDHYDYFDAIFLAERLNAEVESDESTFLLATCYYRAGKPNQAYSLLRRKGCITPQCKFLLAKCCLEFENLSEAETILRGSSSSDEEVHSEQLNIENIVSEYGEHAVFVLRLLSEICYQTERDKVANELNRKILKLNPFIWSSFEMLCNRTELPPPVNPKPSMNHTLSTPLMTNHSVQQNLSTPANNTTDKTDKQLPPIPPCLDPATLFNINQLDNFMYCHSSSAPGVYSCAGAPTEKDVSTTEVVESFA
ncbi:cell division cycle protein 27 homolog [Diaphorina citri]|uniref:Cell division cycle protein 27 homolog n=1 Tax=Diaphorina citri TaxID=121845 RepID=A0A1S3DL66_DIACI|nr:cell division cycle protein 27 homolog [Diaphorina citri]